MKLHTSITKVVAAAKRDAKRELDPRKKRQLRKAIDNVLVFQVDEHELITFYSEDAGMK